MLQKLYNILYEMYGPQGWWPINKTYYKTPTTKNHQFEICLGAILTQNTTWSSVEKSLDNLSPISPEKIKQMPDDKLKEKIKPSGYYNQKCNYIRNFIELFSKNNNPSREELLSCKGIGPETADSMLLYAYQTPSFVVDAYTKRILINLNIINETYTYNQIKSLFETQIKKDLKTYQEYHALLVQHAKNYYQKKPYNCPLQNKFKNSI
jgi:endonuclease III related protein